LRLVTDWLSQESRGRVTRLAIGRQDVKTSRAILKALPSITSLTIHCKKASGEVLAQVAKYQASQLKELIISKVASSVKMKSVLPLLAATVNAEVLYTPRNINIDDEVMDLLEEAECGGNVRELVMQQITLNAMCRLGDVYPNVVNLGMFSTWYQALYPDGIDVEGITVRSWILPAALSRVPCSSPPPVWLHA